MKQEYDVIVEINTIQKDYTTNDQDTINLVSLASINTSELFDLVSYQDSELTGLKGNKTVIKIEKDSITMIRYGKNSSKMYFKQGVRSNSKYNTDYGEFDLEIDTKKLEIEKTDEKNIYKIKIEYDINIQSLFNGFNIMDIIIKKK